MLDETREIDGHHGDRRARHRVRRRRAGRGHLRLVRPGRGRQRLVPRRGHRTSTRTAWPSAPTGRGRPAVDGALPGIVMPAHPTVGDAYRQEYYAGEAEDMAEVLEVGAAKSIRPGTYDDVVVTEDWTPLEPDVVEEKYVRPRRRAGPREHRRRRPGRHVELDRVHRRPAESSQLGSGRSGTLAQTIDRSTPCNDAQGHHRRSRRGRRLAIGGAGSPSPAAPTTTPPTRPSPEPTSSGRRRRPRAHRRGPGHRDRGRRRGELLRGRGHPRRRHPGRRPARRGVQRGRRRGRRRRHGGRRHD